MPGYTFRTKSFFCISTVVVLGISEREGIQITSFDFLKLGFLVMGITVAAGLGILWFMIIL